jgi:hypothetical protein
MFLHLPWQKQRISHHSMPKEQLETCDFSGSLHFGWQFCNCSDNQAFVQRDCVTKAPEQGGRKGRPNGRVRNVSIGS